MSVLKKISSLLGMRGGLCDRFDAAAQELAMEANSLRMHLEAHKKASDPLPSLLSAMWNNYQWRKFTEQPVDGANGSGVRNRPIKQALPATR